MQHPTSGAPRSHKQCPFTVEDLLGRAPIALDMSNVRQEIEGNKILITGAAGSIGSELVMQLATFNPATLILIDQAETALNDLDLQLRQEFSALNIHSYVANITDSFRMESIFRRTRPNVVFHAAAYKHVPLMESHPYEAIKVNIFGVEILAGLAMAYHVRKFIFISTDKAVNPASIMGATKRVAEMYLQSLSQSKRTATQWIITRFGNVLRSNGSFMLTFEKQIAAGGPVTVTHPEVSRYMMTASEACQLVLQASAMGQSGQILFVDMGKQILIADIAKRMIQFSGLKPGDDIQITYTGLRAGEKLQEELFLSKEKALASKNTLIRVIAAENKDLCSKLMLDMLRNALQSGDDLIMIDALKSAVPEFGESS